MFSAAQFSFVSIFTVRKVWCENPMRNLFHLATLIFSTRRAENFHSQWNFVEHTVNFFVMISFMQRFSANSTMFYCKEVCTNEKMGREERRKMKTSKPKWKIEIKSKSHSRLVSTRFTTLRDHIRANKKKKKQRYYVSANKIQFYAATAIEQQAMRGKYVCNKHQQ